MSGSTEQNGPLERYIALLELAVSQGDGLMLPEAAGQLGLPRTTAHRLLRGLARAGFLQDDQSSRSYEAGPRLSDLRRAAGPDGWLDVLARDTLATLTDTICEAACLCRLSGSRVLVVATQVSGVFWRSYMHLGLEMPPHAAAAAKAILAWQNKALIAQIFANDLPALTARTVTDPRRAVAALSQVRRQGYATCIGEIDEGLAGLAVPVADPSGSVHYSLAISGPLERMMQDQFDVSIHTLQRTAAQLEPKLALGRRLAPGVPEVLD